MTSSLVFNVHVHVFHYGADGSEVTSFHTTSLTQFVEQVSSSICFFKGMIAQGHAKEVQICTSFAEQRREIHIEFIRGAVSVNEFDVTDPADVLV
jgi:hypothetical protein